MKKIKVKMKKKIAGVEIKRKEFISPEGMAAYFSNYFGIEISNDDCTLSFGQKVPSSDNKEQSLYDIRRRVIMTKKGLFVLKQIIDEAVKTFGEKMNDNKK
jgi:hypothetical protein